MIFTVCSKRAASASEQPVTGIRESWKHIIKQCLSKELWLISRQCNAKVAILPLAFQLRNVVNQSLKSMDQLMAPLLGSRYLYATRLSHFTMFRVWVPYWWYLLHLTSNVYQHSRVWSCGIITPEEWWSLVQSFGLVSTSNDLSFAKKDGPSRVGLAILRLRAWSRCRVVS